MLAPIEPNPNEVSTQTTSDVQPAFFLRRFLSGQLKGPYKGSMLDGADKVPHRCRPRAVRDHELFHWAAAQPSAPSCEVKVALGSRACSAV